MYIQPITQQPGFSGRLIIDKSSNFEVKKFIALNKLDSKLDEIAAMMKDKQYDLFLFKNEQNPDFYNIAANRTLKDAKRVKEYTVKVQKGIMPTSIVDAAKDAMSMYEKYIAKGAKK